MLTTKVDVAGLLCACALGGYGGREGRDDRKNIHFSMGRQRSHDDKHDPTHTLPCNYPCNSPLDALRGDRVVPGAALCACERDIPNTGRRRDDIHTFAPPSPLSPRLQTHLLSAQTLQVRLVLAHHASIALTFQVGRVPDVAGGKKQGRTRGEAGHGSGDGGLARARQEPHSPRPVDGGGQHLLRSVVVMVLVELRAVGCGGQSKESGERGGQERRGGRRIGVLLQKVQARGGGTSNHAALFPALSVAQCVPIFTHAKRKGSMQSVWKETMCGGRPPQATIRRIPPSNKHGP